MKFQLPIKIQLLKNIFFFAFKFYDVLILLINFCWHFNLFFTMITLSVLKQLNSYFNAFAFVTLLLMDNVKNLQQYILR